MNKKANAASQPAPDNAERQAKAQFDSIAEMAERLQHCQKCSGEGCTLDTATIKGGIGLYYLKGSRKYGRKATDEEREQYHDEEAARRVIEEDALSIEVRSDWHTPGENAEPGEYAILLCTGGPAVRIVGNLNNYQEPESARLEYQDWFTPWTEYRLDPEEESTLIAYASCFYFGS